MTDKEFWENVWQAVIGYAGEFMSGNEESSYVDAMSDEMDRRAKAGGVVLWPQSRTIEAPETLEENEDGTE